jgi:hypothetical protein
MAQLSCVSRPNRNTYENVGNHSFRPLFRVPFRARAPTGFNSPGLRGSFRPRAQGQGFRFCENVDLHSAI